MKKSIESLLFLLFVIYSCSSGSSSETLVIDETETSVNLAVLKTQEAESIAGTQAVIWGLIENDGGSSIIERGVCYSTDLNPDVEDTKKLASVTKGSGEFKVELANLDGGMIYYARAYVVNKKGVAYGNQVSFKTTDLASPLITIESIQIAGAYDLFLSAELKEYGDLDIKEIGLVYNTMTKPTIINNKIAKAKIEAKFKERIRDLTPETLYYVRPYVLTSKGVLYGEEITIRTIKKGNFTYTFIPNGADEATIKRIKVAFDLATTYYNNFTSIVKHVTVNYSPGTPTADANFAGWINVGSNAAYQKAGTAMHEMAHTVGVGQHAKYWELMQNGKWQGKRANEILQMMTNDSAAYVKGDSVHFWPYGVNGAHEDDGSDFLYIMNALILQGMKADGMPSN